MDILDKRSVHVKVYTYIYIIYVTVNDDIYDMARSMSLLNKL